VFLISAFVCSEITSRTLFIEGFRSRRRGWQWNRWHPSNEVETEGGGAAYIGAHAMGPLSQPVGLLALSFSVLDVSWKFWSVLSDLSLFGVP
jgi:hypothetical protein